MRYYHHEHESPRVEIGLRGYSQWNDLCDPDGGWTYDHFQNREFLEHVIERFGLSPESGIRVLEYGCGTGPAACFLASRGFQVDAVDLIPGAIEIAERMASERGVDVAFGVADICALAHEPAKTRYDVVLESFCLQSVVTDQDRAVLFAAVRARLQPDGLYVISTALRAPDRQDEPGFHYDTATGIHYQEVAAGSVGDGVVVINGHRYVPHRRHHTAAALRNELIGAGFQVLSLEAAGSADVVCRLASGHFPV